MKGSHVMDIFHYHRSVTNFLGTTTYHFVGQLVCGLLAFWHFVSDGVVYIYGIVFTNFASASNRKFFFIAGSL